MTPEMIPIADAYRFEFRGNAFHVLTIGSSTPLWVMESFVMEADIREKWWQVKPQDVVIDLGANYGSYTLTALAAGAALVVAFEPSKLGLFDLVSGLYCNGWSFRCLIVNALAGDHEGVRVFYPGSHSIRPEGPEEDRVILKVDAVVQRTGLNRLDWLKVDVEGDEVAALRGSEETLKRFHPKIIIEYHFGFVPGVDRLVGEILSPLGYREEKWPAEREGLNYGWAKWEWRA